MVQARIPSETILNLTDTKQQLSQVVNRVARGESTVVIEKSGLPVAAIISVDDYRRFRAHEAERAARFAAMSRISEAFADVPIDDLERNVEAVLAGIRSSNSVDTSPHKS